MNFCYSSAVVYRPTLLLKKYNENYSELILCKALRQKGYQQINKKVKFIDKEQNLLKSLSRAKSKIKELILCNDFKYFFTLTISPNAKINIDRYNINSVSLKIQEKFKYLSKVCEKLKYIYVIEKHLDGAFHVHGVLDIDDNRIKLNKNGYLEFSYFNNMGFSSVSKIRDTSKISSYITKYISKDIVKTSKGSLYFRSRNLRSAETTVVDINNLDTSFKPYFFNDYVKKFPLDALKKM